MISVTVALTKPKSGYQFPLPISLWRSQHFIRRCRTTYLDKREFNTKDWKVSDSSKFQEPYQRRKIQHYLTPRAISDSLISSSNLKCQNLNLRELTKNLFLCLISEGNHGERDLIFLPISLCLDSSHHNITQEKKHNNIYHNTHKQRITLNH